MRLRVTESVCECDCECEHGPWHENFFEMMSDTVSLTVTVTKNGCYIKNKNNHLSMFQLESRFGGTELTELCMCVSSAKTLFHRSVEKAVHVGVALPLH